VAPAADLATHLGGDDLAEVIYVDHYGNCFTGIRARGVLETSWLVAGGREFAHARVFAAVEPGTAFWYENSSGLVEIAVNHGSAAAALGLAVGTPVAWAD
jgi:S-adenosylmethionine hydrolase